MSLGTVIQPSTPHPSPILCLPAACPGVTLTPQQAPLSFILKVILAKGRQGRDAGWWLETTPFWATAPPWFLVLPVQATTCSGGSSSMTGVLTQAAAMPFLPSCPPGRSRVCQEHLPTVAGSWEPSHPLGRETLTHGGSTDWFLIQETLCFEF